MLMGHLQVSSNLHDPMGRARFPGEAQTGKLTGKLIYTEPGRRHDEINIAKVMYTYKKLSCHRDRIHVIEYFAKSLDVAQGHSKWHC